MKRNMFENVFRALLAAVMILAFWATAPHGGVASSEPYTGPITVRYYEEPASDLAASRECIDSERETRGIPGERNAYLSWWRDNEGSSAEAEWSAAFEACQEAHLWKQGKWNWSAKALIRTEVHN